MNDGTVSPSLDESLTLEGCGELALLFGLVSACDTLLVLKGSVDRLDVCDLQFTLHLFNNSLSVCLSVLMFF